MWGAIISSGSSGGGGGGDYPFSLALAKTRRWKINAATVIPQGAFMISAVNTGIADGIVQVSGGPAEAFSPGGQYNFEAIQNTVDKKMEVSKQITFTPATGEFIEIFVAYPASSAVDPNTI
jgi:hypothetical protein